jgi:hypothetical protein
MKAFDNALSRLLEGAGEDITQGIGEEKRDTLGIDLDNLEVEDLVPSKFNK